MRITGLIALLAIGSGALAWLGRKNGGAAVIPTPTSLDTMMRFYQPIPEIKLGAEVTAPGPAAEPSAATAITPAAGPAVISLQTPIEILNASVVSVEEGRKILAGYGDADSPTVKAMMAAQTALMFASASAVTGTPVTNYAQWQSAVNAEQAAAMARER